MTTATKRLVFLLVFYLLSIVGCFSQLVKWEAVEKELRPSDSGNSADFDFKFKVGLDADVEFEVPLVSCGCTVTKLSKLGFKRNEDGVLSGTVSTIGKHGASRLFIVLKIKESPLGESNKGNIIEERLTIKLFMPERVKLSNGIVYWPVNGPLDDKVVVIDVVQEKSLKLELIGCDNQIFDTSLTELDPGRRYQLNLKPKSADIQTRGAVTIKSIEADGTSFNTYVHLMVK